MAVLVSNGTQRIKEALHQILDTFAADFDWRRGVFIKPNIVFPVKPASGEITSPSLVKDLVFVLRERYGDLDILLGEGVAAGCDPAQNFRVSGYARLAEKLNIPLIDLNGAGHRTVVWKFGKLALPDIAFERVYINLPILKASSACVISGALKNQKGLVLPGVKKHFHCLGLHEQIAQLNAVIQPDLTILDCSRFLGPHVLISGHNCGEIDATACRLLGIDEPEHVRLSRSAGVFAPGYTVQGEGAGIRLRTSPPAVSEFKRIGRLRLWSNPQACTMCRYLFRDVQHNFLKPQYFKLTVKLLFHAVRGAEIIIGKNPQWRKEYPTVICIGACTRQAAKDGGYIHIPGCPPAIRDLYEKLP